MSLERFREMFIELSYNCCELPDEFYEEFQTLKSELGFSDYEYCNGHGYIEVPSTAGYVFDGGDCIRCGGSGLTGITMKEIDYSYDIQSCHPNVE